LRYAKVEPISPASQTTKPLASGTATRWQGYVALEGLGITRIKNQISDSNPAIGNSQINQQYFLFRFAVRRPAEIYLSVFGHINEASFAFFRRICAPPKLPALCLNNVFRVPKMIIYQFV